MVRSLRDLLISIRGRIPRSTWWGASILLWISFFVLFALLGAVAGGRATLAIYPFFFWALFAVAAKRYHDIGKSSAWLLLVLVPLLGPLWVVAELALRRGTRGENRHGTDPLEPGLDYLTVA